MSAAAPRVPDFELMPSPKLTGPILRNRADRTAIAFLKSDRHNRPGSDESYGDRGLVGHRAGADECFSRQAVVQSEHQKMGLCLELGLADRWEPRGKTSGTAFGSDQYRTICARDRELSTRCLTQRQCSARAAAP